MTIEVLNESGQELDVQGLARLSRFVMDRMRVHPLAELCIKAVDEPTIAELNRQWMEKDGATDVLAFPMDELRPGLVTEEPESGVLGDLVLCPAVAERQGETAGHGTVAELELLTVHGILHLLGYDHAEPEEHREMFGLQDRLLGEWRAGVWEGRAGGGNKLTGADVWLLVTAGTLVLLAGGFSAADAALASFSRARADELREEGRAGARRLVRLLEDAPYYLNTLILLRLACEIGAIVIVTQLVRDAYDGAFWRSLLTSIAIMLVVSFVVIGVAPRTLGRQHSERVALLTAGPVTAITSILGPIPRLLILIGNAITPGRGFREGPFSTETELRELVDIAEASSLIEDNERKMIHSVFELGDTSSREVMVPRNDVVYIERFKNLRQTRSLFLKSGFSRLPVIGENLDDVLGFVYLKDVVRRDFDDPDAELTEHVEVVMRPAHFVPDSKPVDALLSEMQTMRQHIAVVVDEYGGTAGLITIEDILEEIVGEITDEYDADEVEVEVLPSGGTRVSSRYPVDDLDELFGIKVVDEDVDSVGGLLAKHLGRVPIPGSHVEAHGLRFEAEGVTGRRNKIGTVLVSRVAADQPEPAPQLADAHE